jgi:putative two-component system protein, hydrogenase maturation factor HypX/HoxX
VKTKDGAVWIQQSRNAKTINEPHPFKVPATLQLAEFVKDIPAVDAPAFEAVCADTFQEVTLEKRGSVGMVGFDFYNGAMSTLQC